MTEHLTDIETEALAHDEPELVSPAARDHLGACESCALLVRQEREASADLAAAFRGDAPVGVDLTALVQHALDNTAQEPPIPSRKTILIAALVGLAAAVACAIPSLPSFAGIAGAFADAVAVVHSLDRVVDLAVPGGWNLVALVGAAVLLLTLLPLRRLLSAASDQLAATAAVAVFIGFALLAASTARALDFEGQWPDGETGVSVDIDDRAAAEVLRAAAEQAGLGFASMVEHDHLARPVSLHVQGTSLRVVVETLLAGAPVTATRTPHMLVLRPSEPTVAVPEVPGPDLVSPVPVSDPPSGSPSDPPPVPDVPTVPTLSASAPSGERVTFGEDVFVGPDEVVSEVVSMGGDVVVEGEVLGSVVTLGGDLDIRAGGTVRGEIVTWGGDVTVAEGADARGDMVTWGGEVDRGEHQVKQRRSFPFRVRTPRGASPLRDHGWLGSALGSGAKYAVLFLVGLLLAVVAPRRLGIVRQAIVRAPVRATAVGLLAFVAVPVAALILLVTVVGIPAAALLGLAAYVGAHAGLVAVAFVLGAALPLSPLKDRPLLQLAAGLAVLLLLTLVPVAGVAVTALAYALGLGAVLLTRLGTRDVA